MKFLQHTRLDLLRQAGASEAELILFCCDGDQLEPDNLEGIHAAFPNATIFVRAYDRRTLIKLKDAPVQYVVREVMGSAVEMGRRALASLKVADGDIDRAEREYRHNDRERLRAQRETGDLRAALDRIITQPSRE